jgi:hypothetical protein
VLVGAEDDVRVEDGQQRVEVARSGGGQERVDEGRLAEPVGFSVPLAPARARARLASWRVAGTLRSTIGAISSKGIAKTSCSTNATRSAGVSVSSTTSSARPTESARSASCSGSDSASLAAGSGRSGSASGCGRDLRASSMLRQTRETTVVSQLPRLWTSLVSARLKRSHASWTASSASLEEPSIR